MTKLFSYVVDHDLGLAPHPSGGCCSLVECKHGYGRYKNIVELAEKNDWVVGTGGVSGESAGKGKLIYAMRVDEKLTLGKYCDDNRFKERIDAKRHSPRKNRFALVSRHFFYFGDNAIRIPARFKNFPLEKKGQGFRYKNFTEDFISDFTNWLETTFKLGLNGWPCDPLSALDTPKCAYKVRRK
jgi:hypothetical protein